VACHFTVPEKGGFKGWLGLAEQVSDISLACRQIGRFISRARWSRAMICSGSAVRSSSRRCRSSRLRRQAELLVYMVYSDKLIDGSPKNSTSSVPIMPWGASDTAVQKCGEFIQ